MTDVATKAEQALNMVRNAKELSYDTEGSGLDWKRNFPIGYVIGTDAADMVYVPTRHGGGGNLPDPNVKVPESATDPYVIHWFEKALSEAFEERRVKKLLTIGHNLKFDCHFSANVGILLGRSLTCTQNNEALLDEYARSYSLDACAQRRGVTAKLAQGMYDHLGSLFNCPPTKSSMEHYWRTSGNDPIAVDYATGDGVTTMELFQAQRKKIEEEELNSIFDIENRLIWTLFRMERRGIRVDVEYLKKLQQKIIERVEQAQQALPEDFNVRSPNNVKAYVTAAGRTDWPTTPKGNPSFDEKWLKTFEEGRHIVTVRKWTNLNNTFVTPLIENHVYNGRVHASLNQLKSDDYGTPARLSCSQPNLQQIPKRDKEIAKLFRSAFLPDEGYEFGEADYSQCEPRLFAHYSKEPALLKGYNSVPFKDMHAVVSEMLSVERDPTAKRINMGILTGMFPKTFAMHMGWDIDTATEKWNEWFEAFPKVREFQNLAKGVISRRGYIKTILGRRGRLEQPRFAYRAVSKIIQGSNADILKYFMLVLDEWLEEGGDIVHLLMTVHDAFEFQNPATPEGRAIAVEMLDRAVKVQKPPFNLAVPFVLDSGWGDNWAEATFGADK